MVITSDRVILEDDIVRLEPFEVRDDMDTVLRLVGKCRYNTLSRMQARLALLKFPTKFWYCYDKKTGLMGGVAYLTKTPDYWMMDAYKDDELMKRIDNTMDYSYRVGKLITDYAMTFTNRLLTIHACKNRGATILCKKLGFEEDYIIMKMEGNHGT